MGGKGGSSPPAIDPNMITNMQMQNMQMLEVFKNQMTQILSQPSISPPLPPVAPIVQEAPKVDWDAKIKELNENAKNLTIADQKSRKSLADTVLTSSLLDDEEKTSKQFYALGQ